MTPDKREARERLAIGFIRVVEARPGYWICKTLGDLRALQSRCDCRNGIPKDYDALLDFASLGGLGLESPLV